MQNAGQTRTRQNKGSFIKTDCPNISRSFKLKWSTSILISVLSSFIAHYAHAQNTQEWIGNNSADFQDGANWSAGSVPEIGIINTQGQYPAIWDLDPSSSSSNLIGGIEIGNASGSNGSLHINMAPDVYKGLEKLDVGTNGGQGALSIDFTNINSSSSFQIYGHGNGVNIGSGTGSQGTVNLLGTGKTPEMDGMSPSGKHLYLNEGTLHVGTDGGRGVINQYGAGLGIGVNSFVGPSVILGEGTGGYGEANILAGGKLSSSSYYSAASEALIGTNGGHGVINVSGQSEQGQQSRVELGTGAILGNGTGSHGVINVSNGADLLTYHQMMDARHVTLGVDGGTGEVTVDGANSTWRVAADYGYGDDPSQAMNSGELHIGGSGNGRVVVSNEGKVSVGKVSIDSYANLGEDENGNTIYGRLTYFAGGTGGVYIADDINSKGELVFGALAGQSAVAQGSLEAAFIKFGQGDGRLVFNHTDNNLHFTVPLEGRGSISHYAGTTWFDQDPANVNGLVTGNSNFSGSTDIYGGTIGLSHDNALGTSTINGKGNGGLIYTDGRTIANNIRIDAHASLSAQVDSGFFATQTGSISGAGDFIKSGDGTLVLTANNTQTGVTRVADGTLQVGTGGTTGSLESSQIALDQTSSHIVFNRSDDVSFAGAVSGQGMLTKEGTGKLSLLGENTYTGATTVNAGTLEFGNDSAAPIASMQIILNQPSSEVVFNRNSNLAYAGVISGSGTLIKEGAGSLTLSSNNTHQNGTRINQGAIILDNPNAGLSGSGQTTIDSDALLGGYGQIGGDVLNDGTIVVGDAVSTLNGGAGNMLISGSLTNHGNIVLAGKTVGNTLNVSGNYSAASGLVINTVLGGDNSPTDRLNITGDTSGHTSVSVYNKGGKGERTYQGIKIIDVGGRSEGTFALTSPVVAGLYEYSLKQSDGQNWYLTSYANDANRPTLRPEMGSYLGNQILAQYLPIHTLYDRMSGKLGHTIDSASWLRIAGNHYRYTLDEGYVNVKSNTSLIHLGTDLISGGQDDRWVAGIMGSIGDIQTKARSDFVARTANSQIATYGVGLYGTWYENAQQKEGLYVDAWAQYNHNLNNVSSQGLASQDYKSKSLTASLEAGYRFNVDQSYNRYWFVEPQAQVVYSGYKSGSFIEDNGTKIDKLADGQLMTRLGVRVGSTAVENTYALHPFVEFNWINGKVVDKMSANGDLIQSDISKNRYELKAGVQGDLDKNWQVWGQASGEWGGKSFQGYSGQIAVKYKW